MAAESLPWKMKALGHDVVQGTKSLTALAIVVGIAAVAARRSSEIVLFLYGIALMPATIRPSA